MKKLFLIFTVPFFLSCSFEYGEDTQSVPENIPKTVLTNAKITSVKKGRIFYTAEMETASTFDKKNYSEIENIKFSQFDKEGKETANGNAERARIKTKTNDAQLLGNINIYSKKEETAIKGQYLNWENEAKILSIKSAGDFLDRDEEIDKSITITKDNGTVIKGNGFRAELSEKKVYFASGVEGKIVVEKEESDETETEDKE